MIKPPRIEAESGSYFLFPSTLVVSAEPCNIQTILGSCVAVCLYDPILKQGGMNHYMLPLWNGEGLESPKYGNIAVDMLIEKMAGIGSKKKSLVAKVFGGANQFENTTINVGERNIQVAETILNKHGINLGAKSVGGGQGRRIVFNSSSGQVMMKYIVKQGL
jgi:chemotaxis protein CheD